MDHSFIYKKRYNQTNYNWFSSKLNKLINQTNLKQHKHTPQPTHTSFYVYIAIETQSTKKKGSNYIRLKISYITHIQNVGSTIFCTKALFNRNCILHATCLQTTKHM